MMTPEQLRLEIVADLDRVIDSWFASSRQRQLCLAMRMFWMLPDAPLDKVNAYLNERKS